MQAHKRKVPKCVAAILHIRSHSITCNCVRSLVCAIRWQQITHTGMVIYVVLHCNYNTINDIIWQSLFVWAHFILAPDASEVGLGAVALAPPSIESGSIRGDQGNIPGMPLLFVQASQTLQLFLEKHIHVWLKSRVVPLGSPRCPKGTHWHPKEAKREARVTPRNAKRSPKTPEKSNKLQNCAHINKIYANSRSNATQRPALIWYIVGHIYICVYIYMNI